MAVFSRRLLRFGTALLTLGVAAGFGFGTAVADEPPPNPGQRADGPPIGTPGKGYALGGAHVLAVAADDHRLAAVVANVPGIDLIRGMRGRYVPPHLRMSPARIAVAGACLLGHAVVDAARGMARATPHYIPVYGRPGHAVFADPELAGLFADLEDGSPTWRNEVAPRFLFTAPRLGPRVLSRISAPVLVTLARDDEVISSAFVRRAIAHVPDHEIIEFGARHFEMYHGQIRDRVIETHLQFLTRHLAPGD